MAKSSAWSLLRNLLDRLKKSYQNLIFFLVVDRKNACIQLQLAAWLLAAVKTSSDQSPPLRKILLTELTEGIVLGSQILCESN